MAIGSSVPPRAYTREILTTAFNWLQSQPDSVRTKATTPDALVALYVQAQRGGASLPGFDAEAPQSSQAFMSDLKNLAEGLKEFDDSRTVRPLSAPMSPITPPASARAQVSSPQASQAAAMAPSRAQKTFPLDEIDYAPAFAASSSEAAAPVATFPMANNPRGSARSQTASPTSQMAASIHSAVQPPRQPSAANYSDTPQAPSRRTVAPLAPTPSYESEVEPDPEPTVQAAPLHASEAPSPASAGFLPPELTERSLQMLREVQTALNLSSEVEAINVMIAIAHKNLKSLLA